MKTFIAAAVTLWLAAAGQARSADNDPDLRRLVTIDVLIAEVGTDVKDAKDLTAKTLLDQEKDGKLSHTTRARLVTVENQTAMVQLGEQVPVVTSRSLVPRGGAGFRTDRPADGREEPAAAPRFASNFTYQNVGTIVSVAPRVESTGSILIDLKIEKSRLSEVEGAANEQNASEPGRLKTVSLRSESTVRIRGGEPVLVEGFQSGGPSDSRGQYIVVSASAEPRPAAADAGVEQKKDNAQLRVFALQNADAIDAVKLLTTVYGSRALRAAADARTNSVIVYGAWPEASGLEELLKLLDERPAAKRESELRDPESKP